MRLVKGILTYTLVLIGIIAIAGVLLFSAMAFLHLSVFGYRVKIDAKSETYEKAVSFIKKTPTGDDVIRKKVYINSNDYNLNIYANKNVENISGPDIKGGRVSISYYDKAIGLVNNEKELKPYGGITSENKVRSVLELNYYDVNGKLVYNNYNEKDKDAKTKALDAPYIEIILHTPKGIIKTRDSSFNVYLPVNIDGGGVDRIAYDLVLNSGKGDIQILPFKNRDESEEKMLNIRSLDVCTTSGNFTVKSIKEKAGEVVLESLKIKTEKGKFDFTNQDYAIENDNPVKIDSVRGDFLFKKFTGGFTTKGENLVFQASEGIYTRNNRFIYKCPHGTLIIKNLDVGNGVGEIITQYAKVDIENVIGDLSVNTTYGPTSIKNSSNRLDIKTINGPITVDNAEGEVIAESKYGDINIKYKDRGWFTNQNGKINVEYIGKVKTNDFTELDCVIVTKNGDVRATGLSSNLKLEASGSSNVFIKYAKIDKNNSLKCNVKMGSGNLAIEAPTVVTGESSGFDVDFRPVKGSNADLELKKGKSKSTFYKEKGVYGDLNSDGGKFEFIIESSTNTKINLVTNL